MTCALTLPPAESETTSEPILTTSADDETGAGEGDPATFGGALLVPDPPLHAARATPRSRQETRVDLKTNRFMWWLNYVTALSGGPPPSPAPKEKLCYQGNRQDDENKKRDQGNDHPNQEENDCRRDIDAV